MRFGVDGTQRVRLTGLRARAFHRRAPAFFFLDEPAEHDFGIALFYPIWNGTAPALLRGFLGQTFRPAFCFPDMKPDERLTFRSAFSQRNRLAGRSGRLVVTIAMPGAAYRWYFRPHPEKNTLRLSGIDPIRKSLVGQAEAPDPRQRHAWIAKMRELGRRAQ